MKHNLNARLNVKFSRSYLWFFHPRCIYNFLFDADHEFQQKRQKNTSKKWLWTYSENIKSSENLYRITDPLATITRKKDRSKIFRTYLLVNAFICFRLFQINVLNTSLIQTAEWRLLGVILINGQVFAMYAPRS